MGLAFLEQFCCLLLDFFPLRLCLWCGAFALLWCFFATIAGWWWVLCREHPNHCRIHSISLFVDEPSYLWQVIMAAGNVLLFIFCFSIVCHRGEGDCFKGKEENTDES